MLGKNRINKFITSVMTLAVISVLTTIAFAAPKNGELTVSGQVTVNGQPAVTNTTIVTGSKITTGANSSAIVSLGSVGKVELLADSSITLNITDNSIVVMLTLGKTRVLNSAGIGATVTTQSATVVADTGQANSFSVDVGCADDARCTQTLVETASGLVTLRSGSSVKQVAAGTDATSGNPAQTGCKPCMRPGSAPPIPVAGVAPGVIAAILIGVGAAAAAAIILGRDNEITTDGNIVVVSPF